MTFLFVIGGNVRISGVDKSYGFIALTSQGVETGTELAQIPEGECMGEKWTSVYRGVRFREHPTRMVGPSRDRYYVIRYAVRGKTVTEGVGWVSDGYSEGEVIHILSTLRRNVREGQGPQSLGEIRETEQAALEMARQAQIEAGSPLHSPTFRDAALAFMEHAKTELASWRSDQGRINNHLLPLVGDMQLQEIDKGHIAELAKKLAHRQQATRYGVRGKSLGPGTVRHCIVLVGRILELARTMPVGPERKPLMEGPNPAHGVKIKRHDDQRWRIATDEEIGLILGYCRNHGKSLAREQRLAVLLALECGGRLEEVVTIRKESIDIRNKLIRLTDTKNDESRSIYPPGETFREVLALSETSGESEWLFAGPAGHLNKCTVSHFFRKATDDLGLNTGITDRRGRLVFHSLRHTYGTRQIMAGTNPMVLKRLMGHKSLSTTERYVHIAEEFLLAQR